MIDKATFAKVTFDGAPPPGVINLGIGQPSADRHFIDGRFDKVFRFVHHAK